MITVIFKPRSGRLRDANSVDPLNLLAASRDPSLYVHNRSWRPPTDIYEIEDKIIVLVEIAGMTEKDFTINMDRNILTIHGSRDLQIEERHAIHQMEIPFGDFTVEIAFPVQLDLEKVSATYNDGFLMVVLPKAAPTNIELNRE